jgi:subtilisin-like proprotein convertase family protein
VFKKLGSSRVAATLATLGLVPFGVVLTTSSPAHAVVTTLSNTAPITINDNANATPYPSPISVSGLTGEIQSVTVTLTGLSHTYVADVAVVLVGPNNEALMLMNSVGYQAAPYSVSNVTLTITDSAPTKLPFSTLPTTGSFKPASYRNGDSFPTPGPLLAYDDPGPLGGGSATFASVFGGHAPNGTWNLFVRDVSHGDSGTISGGWTLSVNTAATTATPFVASASPASGSSATTKVTGTAEADSTVMLYTNNTCTGAVAGSGPEADFAGSGVAATGAPNVATTFWAKATKAGQIDSACSSTSASYVNDSTPPAAPSLSSLSPASPNAATTVGVKGTAEPGSTVKLYLTTDCSGPPSATGTAAELAGAGIEVPVTPNATSTIKATASDTVGNGSPCSSGVSYTNDSAPPAPPSALSVSPTSPGSSTIPVVTGTAEDGSTVKIYPTASCTGPAAATGTAAAFGSSGLPVIVAAGSATAFRATATDALGNTSVCSTSSVTYLQQNPAPPPAAPDTTLTEVPKKQVTTTKKKAKVSFSFSSATVGATFECSVDGNAFAACTSGQTFKIKVGKHTFAVRAVAAGQSDPTPGTYSFKIKIKIKNKNKNKNKH